MSIAYVGERGTLNTGTGSGGTQSITLGSSCSAGNLVVLLFVARNATADDVPTVTDTHSNTWVVAEHLRDASEGNIWFALAATLQNAGTLVSGNTVTLSATNLAQSRVALLEEFSGITSATCDVHRHNTLLSQAALTMDTGVSGTTSQAEELAIALFAWDGFFNITGSASGWSGFTTSSLYEGTWGKGLSGLYKVLSSTGTVQATQNNDQTVGGLAGLATFKAPVSAPTRRNLPLLGVGP